MTEIKLMDAEAIKELKDLAQAATPGPWEHLAGPVGDCIEQQGGGQVVLETAGMLPEDVDYIAAAHPQAILSLIAEVERLQDFARWIPVDERVPEWGKRVRVLTDTKQIGVDFYDPLTCEPVWNAPGDNGRVMYWMALADWPATTPPAGGQDQEDA